MLAQWSFYGTDALELRTMVMKILSLTTSSSIVKGIGAYLRW